MFRELVALGHGLDEEGKLPPSCFYEFGKDKPIRWLVHLGPDKLRLEKATLFAARPFSGRTRRIEAHLLTDEAGYAFGVGRKSNGEKDQHATKKHLEFVRLTEKFLSFDGLQDLDLRRTVEWLLLALVEGWLTSDVLSHGVASDHWVSFIPEHGRLSGTHLFEHPQARAFWSQEMKQRCMPQDKRKNPLQIIGTCAICVNPTAVLVRKMPVKVRLNGVAPLHSLDDSAYTSYIAGAATSDTAHLGICFECCDIAARAFNYLSNSPRHRRDLVRDPEPKNSDKLTNQVGLFWLKAPGPIRVEEAVIDFNDLSVFDFGAAVASTAPTAELSQLRALLKLPWHPVDSALRLDDYGFHLAVLSPNIGRIALRDWFTVSLDALKANLAEFLDGTNMVSAQGDAVRPASVATVIAALGSASANLPRSLLRSAYLGARPPAELMIQAGQRLNHLLANERSLRRRQERRGQRASVWEDDWPHALAAAIKLVLMFGDKEVEAMPEVNPLFRSRAYQCGRLLAALEEAQQGYHWKLHRKWLDNTIASRSYGRASSSPIYAFPNLVRLAVSAHLPKLGKHFNDEVNSINETLVELGGMPAILSLPEQAEFGLGFFQQRALMQAEREARKKEWEAEGADEE